MFASFAFVQGYLGGLCSLVELRQPHQSFCRRVSVQDAIDEGRNRGEDQVEEDQYPGIGHDAPRETTEELIPKQQVHKHLQKEGETQRRILLTN